MDALTVKQNKRLAKAMMEKIFISKNNFCVSEMNA